MNKNNFKLCFFIICGIYRKVSDKYRDYQTRSSKEQFDYIQTVAHSITLA